MRDRQHALTVSRVFDSTPERLYAAWTDPDLMRMWMGIRVEADVRVGGRCRREVLGEDGAVYVHAGHYELLEPNQRIVQSFSLEGVENNPFEDEQIEITIRPLSTGRTELVLTDRWNGPAMTPEEGHAADEAWGGWLAKMEAVL